MKSEFNGAGRLLAAFALTALTAACNNNNGRTDAAPTQTPSPVVALTPRPPGPPTYYPLARFTGPNPVDVTFTMQVVPYHGLTIGGRFSVVLNYVNKERNPVTISPNMQFGQSLIIDVVDAAGGTIGRVDNHDPATNRKYPLYVRSVDFDNYTLKPGTTRIRVVLQLIDVLCPGGGDFISEVSGGVGRIIKRGSNGGRHLVWVENDALDYSKQAHGSPSPPHSLCRPQSVE